MRARTRRAAALVALAALLAACQPARSDVSSTAPPAAAPVPADCPGDPERPKRQLRGAWIATVHHIDWPSRAGLSAAEQQEEYRALLDEAVALNLNAVFVQVRPQADAFYPSAYEPWSRWLTGEQGADPGYDPMEFLVAETHARGLEFHAWFNPYRIGEYELEELHPDHPARRHPGWTVRYGGALHYNPGLPHVRDFVADAIVDTAVRYDVDGVHFDDFFYPYPVAGEEFDDAAAYAAHGGGAADRDDWRRANVDALVSQVSARLRAAKPWVKFGISPFGVWRNAATDPSGSDTRAGVQNYDDLHADVRTWIRSGWIDYVVPQLYWPRGFTIADYDVLVPWWAAEVDGSDTQLYIGQAAYMAGEDDPAAWRDPGELASHLAANREYPQVAGDLYFSMTSLGSNAAEAAGLLRAGPYAAPALLPEPTRAATGRPPPGPVGGLRAAAGPDGAVELAWSPAERARAYAVYRVEEAAAGDPCALADASRLIAVVPATGEPAHTDPAPPEGTAGYTVTALDRLHAESAPAPLVPPAS
ncbi:glycoside hydrolase family 10 protein [Allonocardiopsis opalescens]|uniref:Uncharacterized lipoprotein YddW (UPF0748 family) n=1 Tax=Allonocardiopsis opalescens TaxID=1144618 RepID=A0A2T0Q4Q6_9ACTN|nr:family 10 glycosylhydrolase [Allonocardiopsis opalescens]PRX98784.1 uncharacterized lipoprotein YddW (UPF0748 family) [Allonocardiopsis opalescens]